LKEEGWDGARTTSSCELRRKTVASEGASSHPRGECQIEPFNALKFGAAALAALIQERNRQRGRKIGIILSGGNIDFDLFRRWLMGRTKIAAESFAL
jgi:hypothetical protein